MIHPPLRNSGRTERGREQDPNKRGRGQREAGEQVGKGSGAVQANSAKSLFHTVQRCVEGRDRASHTQKAGSIQQNSQVKQP